MLLSTSFECSMKQFTICSSMPSMCQNIVDERCRIAVAVRTGMLIFLQILHDLIVARDVVIAVRCVCKEELVGWAYASDRSVLAVDE